MNFREAFEISLNNFCVQLNLINQVALLSTILCRIKNFLRSYLRNNTSFYYKIQGFQKYLTFRQWIDPSSTAWKCWVFNLTNLAFEQCCNKRSSAFQNCCSSEVRAYIIFYRRFWFYMLSLSSCFVSENCPFKKSHYSFSDLWQKSTSNARVYCAVNVRKSEKKQLVKLLN